MNVGTNGFWLLDPAVTYLNHGSFGSCPRPVLCYQQALRDRMERQPMSFLARDLEKALDDARAALAAFVHAEPENLVFVPNATAGVNTVLRSLRWEPGDELLTTNQAYNACNNALAYAAERWGARVVTAHVPFPVANEDLISDVVMEAVTPRTKLALIDHVTSETGLVFPIRRLVDSLQARGIDVLVDGAHAPGMIEVDLEQLGAAYYTANAHKWLCAPKGAGFLYVRPDRQEAIRPLSISHGANSPRRDRSRFLIEFGWTGTCDPTAFLAVPEALRVMAEQHTDGWPGLRKANHRLVAKGRRLLCEALGIPVPCPDSLLGAMAAMPLPDARSQAPSASPLAFDPLQDRLAAEFAIEAPVFAWPDPPKRLLRVSAQIYNTLEDYKRLADVLQKGGLLR